MSDDKNEKKPEPVVQPVKTKLDSEGNNVPVNGAPKEPWPIFRENA